MSESHPFSKRLQIDRKNFRVDEGLLVCSHKASPQNILGKLQKMNSWDQREFPLHVRMMRGVAGEKFHRCAGAWRGLVLLGFMEGCSQFGESLLPLGWRVMGLDLMGLLQRLIPDVHRNSDHT